MPDSAVPGWGGDPAPSSFPDPGRPGPLDSSVAADLLKRGQVLADQGDWNLAAGTFARVVGNGDPVLHTAALLGLAECRYRLDDEPAALQAWISATQAPENELTWRAWKALAVARVRSNDLAGAARAYREAGRRAPASEQAEIQSRVGWLSKELGDDGGAEQAFSRIRASGRPQPLFTYAILAITAIITFTAGFDDSDLRQLLWLDKGAMYTANEYWRLLTVALVHGSIIHLMFNMYALWIIGPIVEALFGPWRFLGIYLVCAAAGSAASYATSASFAVGASGAVFGLFGVLLVADRVHKPALTRNARNLTMQIGMLIGINLIIGFSIPGIDNAAHVGGLLAGAALGFLLVPAGATLGSFWSRRSPEAASLSGPAADPNARGKPLRWGGVAALISVIVIVIAMSPITYEPPLWWLVAGQPAVPAETVGDAIAIPSRTTSIITSRHGRIVLQGQWEVDGQGAPWRSVGPFVTQDQTPPGGDAAVQLQPTVEGAARDAVSATERVAA
ncbi:MAG: rhomboid family intramembrane serine protease [Chloroflexota bacterium]|nr:rhomboid family intramembrane serine protease [Chloroflexota bacterium]